MNISKFFKKYYPLIILFVIILAFNIFIDIRKADFLWFLDKANTTNLFDYLVGRYHDWTSRLIVEFVLVGILKLNYIIIFKTLNTLVMFLIPFLILKIFFKEINVKNQLLVITLYLCYNFRLMNSAGWYATLINYMWPLLCLLVGLIPIKNYLNNKNEKWYLNLIYIANIIFACNQEQTCAILFGVYLIFFIFTIINKRISKFSIISLIISLSSLFFILTCPGNAVRNISETAIHYPQYANFGFAQKVYLGFTTIMTEYLINYNVLLFILCLIACIIIFKTKKNVFSKTISLFPLGIIIAFNFMDGLIMKLVPNFGIIKSVFFEENLKNFASSKKMIILLTSFSIVFLSSIIHSIFTVLSDKEKISFKTFLKKYYILFLFLIGLASRLIIGFSSTIFISGFRTNIFFDFSIILTIILLVQKYYKELKNELKYIISFSSIISIINVISIFISLWR